MSTPLSRWPALLAFTLLPACGDDSAPEVEVPTWAHVAPEQVAEAEKHGVPVAFENELGMRFVLIPAGTFAMGSPEDTDWHVSDEVQHEVNVRQPFYMSIHEVTNGQFRRYRPRHDSRCFLGADLNADDLPVADVAWRDATAFASWLSERDGRRIYHLPSEEEWEYACRAGTTTEFSWGDEIADGKPFVNGLDRVTKPRWGWPYEALPWDDGCRGAAPVGSFEPNPWGLHDMQGNVCEWCADAYAPYASSSTPESTESAAHVTRGGSWETNAACMRSASRHQLARDQDLVGRHLLDDFGFRLVSPLPEPGEK